MKTTTPLRTGLRLTAAAVLLGTFGTWFATGRHLGWTQTSVTTMAHDDITDIDYPVRRPGFVAGVEVLALGLAVSATLAAASALPRRRRARHV